MHSALRMCVTALLMLLSMSLYAQDLTVTGTVKDAQGEPVVGASVVVQGRKTGVITDVDGNYTIKCSPRATLLFSYVGYKNKSVAVAGRTQIDVVFEDNENALNEVVVTALGIKREAKALGYAVTEVKAAELERANTISPVSALQGKVAGVEINQSQSGRSRDQSVGRRYVRINQNTDPRSLDAEQKQSTYLRGRRRNTR